jgi:signal transduction histidine kinase
VKGVLVASAPLVVLLGAWLAGVARQAIRDSRIERRRRATAEAHATQADQVAADEAQRSHLAREVHDLVGHSLAVIVAQADSIRFLRDADAIREAAGAIGATARASLVEVREVLSRTGADVRYPGSEDLDAVIRQVSDAGVPLRDEHEGAAVAMDEASAHAARRVLQEMLTNALKHGRSDTVISVRRVWTGEALQVTVSNEVLRPERPLAERGLGIVGMRRRMAELGGTFRSAVVDDRYEASASFPLHPDASSGAA